MNQRMSDYAPLYALLIAMAGAFCVVALPVVAYVALR